MDKKQQFALNSSIAGFFFTLLVAVFAVTVFSGTGRTVLLVLDAVLSFGSIVALMGVSPSYNVGGKAVLGVVATIVSAVLLVWFMSWGWFAIYFLTCLMVVFGTCAAAAASR